MLNIPEEIKEILKSDTAIKNFRVHFPNGEHEDLTNNEIVTESVQFTESICSKEGLEFGLCESPYIKFDCVLAQNIKGAKIECSMEIFCDATVEGAVFQEDLNEYVYPIKYGTFYVDSCKREGDMTKRNVIAYGIAAYIQWKPTDAEIARETELVDTPDDYRIDARLLINDVLNPKDVGGIATYPYEYEIVGEQDTEVSQSNAGHFISGNPLSMTTSEGELYTSSASRSGFISAHSLFFNISKVTLPPKSRTKVNAVYDAYESTNMYSEFKSEILDYIDRIIEAFRDDSLNVVMKEKKAIDKPFSMFLPPEDYLQEYYDLPPLAEWESSAQYEADLAAYAQENIQALISYRNKLKYLVRDSTSLFMTLFLNPEMTEWYEPEDDYISTGSEPLDLYFYSGLKVKGTFPQYENWAIQRFMEDTASFMHTSPSFLELFQIFDPYKGTDDRYTGRLANGEMFYKNDMMSFNIESYEEPYLYPVSLPRVASGDYYTVAEPLQSMDDIVKGFCELQGKFGFFDRSGFFNTISLGNLQTREKIRKRDYSEIVYDDELTKRYGLVKCTYQNTNDETVSASYAIVDDYSQDKYLTYDVSNNYFVKNQKHTQAEIMVILETIGNAIEAVQYYPLELEGIGLPYVEAGDKVEIEAEDGALETVILARTLNGIQTLSDSIENNANKDGGSGNANVAPSGGGGGGGGGSVVSIEQVVISGTELARITVDGTVTSIFAPSGQQRDKDVIYDRGTFGQTMSVEGYTIVSGSTTYTKYLPEIASNHIHFTGQGANKWSGIGTDELINFANYDKLIVRVKGKSNAQGTGGFQIRITKSKAKGNDTANEYRGWRFLDSTTMGDYQNYEFDLKGISQPAYLFMYCQGNASREVYIEKIELVRSEKHYLYNHGTEVVEWDKSNTNKLSSSYTADGTITINANSIEIMANGNAGAGRCSQIITQNPVDLSEYTYLYVNSSFGTDSGGYAVDVSNISGMAYIVIVNWRVSGSSNRRSAIYISTSKENYATNSLATLNMYTASASADTPTIVGQIWLIE